MCNDEKVRLDNDLAISRRISPCQGCRIVLHCNNIPNSPQAGRGAAKDLLQGVPMTVHDAVLDKPKAPAGADVQSIFRFRGAAPDLRRIALVGTYAPRKCGIATFGNDIVEKLAEFHPNIAVDVYALDDRAAPLAYAGRRRDDRLRRSRGLPRRRAADQRERGRRGLAAARIRHLRRPRRRDGVRLRRPARRAGDPHAAHRADRSERAPARDPRPPGRARQPDHGHDAAIRADLLADEVRRPARAARRSSSTARPTGRSAAPSEFKAQLGPRRHATC